MQFVGQHLKSKRVSQKIKLETVSSELNISLDLLNKIENDEIDRHIDPIYFLGHIRAYSNFLKLDASEIIKQYKLQTSFNKKIEIKNITKPINNYSYANLGRIFSFASILIIFSTFYLLFVQEKNQSPEYAIIPDVPENLIPIIEKTSIDIALDDNKLDDKNFVIDNFNENISSSSANAAIDKNQLNSPSTMITLKFINPTWIQLRDSDDNIVISQLMSQEDQYSYDLNFNYSLTAGNAGNILVLINNEVRGKIGEFGEVVDSIILDNNFNN